MARLVLALLCAAFSLAVSAMIAAHSCPIYIAMAGFTCGSMYASAWLYR